MLSQIEIERLAEALAAKVCAKLKSDTAQTDTLLDTRDAASLLGCSVATVERLTRTGDLPSVKIGRLRRFHRSELLARLSMLREEE